MASRSAEVADARRVALGLGLGLSVLALVSYLRGRFLVAGVAFGLVCLVALGGGAKLPVWIAISRALNALALVLARGLSRLVLCVLFYGVLTPVGLLLRLLGRRPLDTAWKDDRASYWQRARPRSSDLERYQKLY